MPSAAPIRAVSAGAEHRVGRSVTGAGLGLRRELLEPIAALAPGAIDFVEIAPENWIGIGGRNGRRFCAVAERYPVALHGLSLNIGGADPLDFELLGDIREFAAAFDCPFYSDHLSFCADDGHLYELLPLPFTVEAVAHVADRVRTVQDFLGRRIALENPSYYLTLPGELDELQFITAVLAEADCDLLLDVNNVYVNSVNHGYDPVAFVTALPAGRVAYMHIAGHHVEADDLLIDTHGAGVIDSVWELLAVAYRHFGVMPTLLERDFNLPPLPELLAEISKIRAVGCVHGGAYETSG